MDIHFLCVCVLFFCWNSTSMVCKIHSLIAYVKNSNRKRKIEGEKKNDPQRIFGANILMINKNLCTHLELMCRRFWRKNIINVIASVKVGSNNFVLSFFFSLSLFLSNSSKSLTIPLFFHLRFNGRFSTV